MSSLKNLVIFIGPPGSGKGSLSSLCVEKLGWKQLSTGNLCRKHIAEQTEIGKRIDFAIKSGKLVSDELINTMVVDWFHLGVGGADTVILDGYPRTVAQASSLSKILKNEFSHLNLSVIRLVIPDGSIINRLGGRYVCSNQNCQAVYSLTPGSSQAPKNDKECDICLSQLSRRKDDNPEAVAERLNGYHKHEQGLLEFYSDEGQEVLELGVDGPLGQGFQGLKKLIGVNE